MYIPGGDGTVFSYVFGRCWPGANDSTGAGLVIGPDAADDVDSDPGALIEATGPFDLVRGVS